MRRPRLRFAMSLRAMLLVVLALGLWLGWLVNSANRQRRAIAEVKKYNGYIDYNYEYKNGHNFKGDENGNPVTPRKTGLPERFRLGLGDDYFHDVTVVGYSNRPISDATLAPLETLSGIERLCFISRSYRKPAPIKPPPGVDKLTEIGLKRLEGLTHLRSLMIDIEGSRLDSLMRGPNPTLQHVKLPQTLEELELNHIDISDNTMPSLRSLPRLRSLSIWSGRVTGSCLAPLRGTHTLENLVLIDNPVSPEGMANIGAITSLKELHLHDTGINDAGLAHLSELTKLTLLSLGSNHVTDAGLIHLSKMTDLKHLLLDRCAVDGSGLAALKDMKQLDWLALSWTNVNDDGLKFVQMIPHLESLDLDGTSVTDAGLVHLKTMKSLRNLSVNSTKVTQEGIDELLKSLPSLKVN